MKRRDAIEILLRLLCAASREGGATKSRLVRESGLNFIRCERYISVLTQKGLLQQETRPLGSASIYKITPWGREIRDMLRLVNEALFGTAEQVKEGYENYLLVLPRGK
jgi:predicted transcriptional regulator